MKRFKGLTIPDNIHFLKFVDEYLAGNDKTTCGMITNGGLNIDYWEGVTNENSNCRNVLCAKCIFFDQNAEKRLEYFKKCSC